MVTNITLAFLLIGMITLACCVLYLKTSLDKVTNVLETFHELFQINRDTLGVISEEQDKSTLRIKASEERISALQNKYGQLSKEVRKMAQNAIYEADND